MHLQVLILNSRRVFDLTNNWMLHQIYCTEMPHVVMSKWQYQRVKCHEMLKEQFIILFLYLSGKRIEISIMYEVFIIKLNTFYCLSFHVLLDIYFLTLNTYQHYEQSGIWGCKLRQIYGSHKSTISRICKEVKFGRKCVRTQKKNLIDDRFTC